VDRTARVLAFRNDVLERIARGASVPEILDVLVRGAEDLIDGVLCSVLLLDAATRTLHHGAAPSLPDAYCRAIDGMAIGVGQGSCGTSAASGELVVVEDIDTHPYWAPYREIAALAGVRACWSQPIRSTQGAVLGTFAMYYREPRAPGADDLELIERSAHAAGLAIELARHRAHLEELVAARTAELRAALDDVKTLRGMLPICAWCKRVRDDGGYWAQLEAYIAARSEATFTHGICPECAGELRSRS
jgi:GAF domain-containing protein